MVSVITKTRERVVNKIMSVSSEHSPEEPKHMRQTIAPQCRYELRTGPEQREELTVLGLWEISAEENDLNSVIENEI